MTEEEKDAAAYRTVRRILGFRPEAPASAVEAEMRAFLLRLGQYDEALSAIAETLGLPSQPPWSSPENVVEAARKVASDVLDEYQRGLADGKEEGYREGYDEGHTEGWAAGYEEGRPSCPGPPPTPAAAFWSAQALIRMEDGGVGVGTWVMDDVHPVIWAADHGRHLVSYHEIPEDVFEALRAHKNAVEAEP